MTRSEFAKRFHWDKVVWVGGMSNAVGVGLQPLAILQTHEVAGVSIPMFLIFMFMQTAFGIEFFLKKSWGGVVSMGLSWLLSLLTVVLVLHYR